MGCSAIGSVRLAITEPCPRCVMITLPQGDLSKDSGILRTAAQHNAVNVGVYASVINGGTIRRGDTVVLAWAGIDPVPCRGLLDAALQHVAAFQEIRHRRDCVSRPPIGSLCRVRPRRSSHAPLHRMHISIKPPIERTAGCHTVLAAARAAKLAQIKAGDFECHASSPSPRPKVHLPRAGY